MQFLYRWYNTHAEILRDDIQLGYTSNPIYGLAKYYNTLPNKASPNLLFCLLTYFLESTYKPRGSIPTTRSRILGKGTNFEVAI